MSTAITVKGLLIAVGIIAALVGAAFALLAAFARGMSDRP